MRDDLNPYPPAAGHSPSPAPQPTSGDLRGYRPIQPEGNLRRLMRKLLVPLALLVALLAKFKFVLLALTKVKFLATAASMLVSVAGYAVFWGWRFAVGFVALLFVHELGHVLEARRQGLKTNGVYFVPFLGAVMLLKEQTKDAVRGAWLGLAGPIVGSVGAALAWLIGVAIDSDLWVALGFTGFLLNLFNLIPVFPLDGGWATAVFHPVFWMFGLLGLAALFFAIPNPIIALIVIVGAFELWKRWRGTSAATHLDTTNVTGGQRAAIAAVYLGLAALLGVGVAATHVERNADGTLATAPAISQPVTGVTRT